MSDIDASSEQPAPLPTCPRCEGPMWDNREGKRNPKAPDFKCKDRECDGVIWPPRGATATPAGVGAAAAPSAQSPAARKPDGAPAAAAPQPPATGMPACPICGGAMWDDRDSKRNPRAPDFKCRNKPRERGGPGCEGVIWPSRDGSPSPYPASAPRRTPSPSGRDVSSYDAPPRDDAPPHDDDDLPF